VSDPGFNVAKTYAVQEGLVYDGRMVAESKIQLKCKKMDRKIFYPDRTVAALSRLDFLTTQNALLFGIFAALRTLSDLWLLLLTSQKNLKNCFVFHRTHIFESQDSLSRRRASECYNFNLIEVLQLDT